MQKIVIVIGLILLTAFSSCKKDDPDNDTNSDLIGTWAEKPSIEQFIFIFGSSGQGTFQVKNCTTNQILETDSFTYVFDSKTNKIDFLGLSDMKSGYITFFGKTSLRIDFDKWSEELYKQ
jgi:hypothetical protein